MRKILGILILSILLIGIGAAQFPWGNQDYWGSPYGGYTTSYQGQHYQNPHANVFYMYDSYGMNAGYAGFNHYNHMWEYNSNGINPYGYIVNNPYRY